MTIESRRYQPGRGVGAPRLSALLAGVSATVLLALPAHALAQAASPQAAAAPATVDNNAIGDIVVTARKRSENLLTVPVTVSAFTAEDMAAKGITSLTDVADFTPGLKLDAVSQSRNDRSSQTLIIRGMTPTFNGNVSVFIDGAPVVGNGFVEGVDEVDRVEVLKGPQSATFGRATFGGAVNLVTSNPTDSYHASVDASVETYGGYDLKGMVEGPIVPGLLTGMLQVKDFHTDGTYVNAANPNETIGAQSTYAINGTLRFTPTPNLSIKVFGDYWIDHDGEGATGIFNDTTYNCAAGATGSTKNYLCGAIPKFNVSTLAVNDTIDTAVYNAEFSGKNPNIHYMPGMAPDFTDHAGLERRAYHLHDIIDYDIPTIDATLTSITSYDLDQFEFFGDADNQDTTNIPNPFYTPAAAGTLQPYVNWPLYVQYSQWGYSQEFRLQGGSHGPFHWGAGASYVYQESGFVAGGLIDIGALDFQQPSTVGTETSGAFFSLGYDILPQVTVSFDGRVENERQVLYSLLGGRTPEASENFTNFMPRALIQYKPTRDVMFYASYSQGVNPGGFNDNLISFNASQQAYLEKLYGIDLNVAPEKLTNYELGVKGKFWDGRAELTADVYHADWNNQVVENNVTVQPPGALVASQLQIYQNVGLTELNGVEIEGTIKPVDGLTANGSLGYTPSDIRKFICTVCQASITGSTNVTGNQLPNVAALTANLGVEYRHPVVEGFEGYGRVDWVYSGKIYEDPTNLAWINPTNRVNLHIGVTHDRATLEGYVTNLFNDLGYVDLQQNSDLIHGGNAVIVGLAAQRTFGLRFRESF